MKEFILGLCSGVVGVVLVLSISGCFTMKGLDVKTSDGDKLKVEELDTKEVVVPVPASPTE